MSPETELDQLLLNSLRQLSEEFEMRQKQISEEYVQCMKAFNEQSAAQLPSDFMGEQDRGRSPAVDGLLPTPTHPGRLLREYIGAETVADFSQRHGFMSSEISEVLEEQAPITPGLASKLAEVFGTNPSFWTTLQRLYEERCSPLRGPGQNWVTFETDGKGSISESRNGQKVIHGSNPALWPPYIHFAFEMLSEEGCGATRIVRTIRERDFENVLRRKGISMAH